MTLSGFVRSYTQKWEAERTAKRVIGVTGLANDIGVRFPIFNQRPDPEIARDAVSAIQSELPYSSEHIRVLVRPLGIKNRPARLRGLCQGGPRQSRAGQSRTSTDGACLCAKACGIWPYNAGLRTRLPISVSSTDGGSGALALRKLRVIGFISHVSS